MNPAELLKRAGGILGPLDKYHHQCHAASLKLVKAGVGDRVARGRCDGVGGQHSWAVVGDPYNPELVIDPTLWSYRDDVTGVFIGSPDIYGHRPHGKGNIWEWGRPSPGPGPAIRLTPKTPLSPGAESFVELLGDLDEKGWHALAASAPVEGWEAGEIYRAMLETEKLKFLVPIDRVGMLTDLNPSGLYF